MKKDVQVLRDEKGKPTHVVVPYRKYLLLSGDEEAEEKALIALADETRGDVVLPARVANRILDGENAVRVIREHRGLTQAALAKKVRTTTPYVSQIETGARTPSLGLLIRIGKVLDVPIDLLAGKTGQ